MPSRSPCLSAPTFAMFAMHVWRPPFRVWRSSMPLSVYLCWYPYPAIPVPSVAFGVKLGEHGADYTTTCELKSLESVTNQADSNLARTRDKDRCSRHT